MKIIIPLIMTLLFVSCTKKILEKYNDRLIGEWAITETKKTGIGSSNKIFDGGVFNFYEDGQVRYKDMEGNIYTGDWNLDNDTFTSTDSEGNTRSETRYILFITVRDVDTHAQKSDVFEIINFPNRNRFKGKIENDFNTVIYTFERR